MDADNLQGEDRKLDTFSGVDIEFSNDGDLLSASTNRGDLPLSRPSTATLTTSGSNTCSPNFSTSTTQLLDDYNQARIDIINSAGTEYDLSFSTNRCCRCGWGKRGKNHKTNVGRTTVKFCTVAKEFYYHEQWEVYQGYEVNDTRPPMRPQSFKRKWKKKRQEILGYGLYGRIIHC